MILDEIERDLKQAMLARDEKVVSTLRGIKSALQYVSVEKMTELKDEEIIIVLQKESKKRQEAADLYIKNNNQDRADAELAEKKLIDKYLPEQLSDDEIKKVIDQVISDLGETTPKMMGQIINEAKQKTAGSADGAAIARLVKERIHNQ